MDCDTIDIVEAHGLVELKLEDFCLVCDDEGIFNGGKVNGIASLLYGFMEHGQPLVGHVMVCKNKYTNNGIETVGMTDDDLKTLYTAIEAGTRIHKQEIRRYCHEIDSDHRQR